MTVEVSGILVAAHELKAPLSLIRQLTLALDLAPNPTVETRLRSQLVEVSERALRQVEDLAKIARLDDGLFETEPVAVRNLCNSVLQEMAPLFGFEGRKLSVRYQNRSRVAVANRDLLYSVVYNFCVNAMRYSDAASESLLVVQDVKNKIRISVRDFGPALPVTIWQQLQAGELQAPATITMRPGSSGLGLYIASQFARHMRAELGAIRHRDGASFFVDLPISSQAMLPV